MSPFELSLLEVLLGALLVIDGLTPTTTVLVTCPPSVFVVTARLVVDEVDVWEVLLVISWVEDVEEVEVVLDEVLVGVVLVEVVEEEEDVVEEVVDVVVGVVEVEVGVVEVLVVDVVVGVVSVVSSRVVVASRVVVCAAVVDVSVASPPLLSP